MATWSKVWDGLSKAERRHVRILSGHRSTTPISDIELEMIYILDRLDIIAYEYQFPIPGTRLHADFYIPLYHLIIETLGCGYHQCPTCYPKPWKPRVIEKDKIRNDRLRKLGYTNILYVWTHDFAQLRATELVRQAVAALCERASLYNAADCTGRTGATPERKVRDASS